MLSFTIRTITREEVKSNGEPIKEIGDFIVDDVFAIESLNPELEKINMILCSDWDFTGISSEEILDSLDESDDTVNIFVVNLHEIDAIENSELPFGAVQEMIAAVVSLGFADISKFVGYETRAAFVYSGNELEKELVEHMMY
jgi:hypothetical protein